MSFVLQYIQLILVTQMIDMLNMEVNEKKLAESY